MASKKAEEYGSFDEITGRLDEIVGVVRDKNTSLERSLDLFDEAIKLGSAAVDMVDSVDFTEAEAAALEARAEEDAAGEGDADAPAPADEASAGTDPDLA